MTMPPDIAAELQKDAGHLQAILPELDKVQPPELVRPDVPHGQPATEELVRWASQVYVYSIVCHFREILRSTLTLYDAGQVAAVFLCVRALFEMAAHIYYVKKHVFQHLDNKDFDAAWKFMVKINAGSRYMKEKYGEKLNGELEIEESPKIQKAVATFNEYFKGREKVATEEYSFLSEFSHPNSFAFTSHIEWQEAGKPNKQMKMTFVKPPMETLIQAIPCAVMTTFSVLLTGSEFLERLKDDSLNKPLQEVLKITEPK
jgi:hypothetical protein